MTSYRRIAAPLAAALFALTVAACGPGSQTVELTASDARARASQTASEAKGHAAATKKAAAPAVKTAPAAQPGPKGATPVATSATKPVTKPVTKSGTKPGAKPVTKPVSVPAAATKPAAGTALAVLATLPVKGRAPMTGYSRAQFGPAWFDVDRNGCDTRNDILERDLRNETFKDGTRGCVVLTGTFLEPYSGQQVIFQRGPSTSTKVQIDHVVALADAWQTGAQQWPAGKRLAYANDPLVLLAADGPLNGQKGASNAASWLPPNKGYRCAYVARQVAVKATYGLWVTAPEKDAIARVLATCPAVKVPTSGAAPVEAPARPGVTQPAPAPQPAPPAVPAGPAAGADVYYPNCAAVRAAGKAPLHVGDPGYSRKLDRDGDGSACE